MYHNLYRNHDSFNVWYFLLSVLVWFVVIVGAMAVVRLLFGSRGGWYGRDDRAYRANRDWQCDTTRRLRLNAIIDQRIAEYYRARHETDAANDEADEV